MKVLFSTTVSDYLEKVEPLLLKKEASNHVMLGLINYLKKTIKSDVHFGYIESNGEVIYAFMQTPPNHWLLADVNSIPEQTIEILATYLYKNAIKVPGVQGPTYDVEQFVEIWKKYKKVNPVLHKNEWIYRLDDIPLLPNLDGELRLATKQEHPLIKSWLIQFGKETKEGISEMKADQLARKYIENQSLYVWVIDGIPVSMANQSVRTRHGASISAVFTPDEYKHHGFATSIVSAFSQKLLQDGYQFCCLSTDRENPISNYVYQKIGYRVVGSLTAYSFL